MPEFTVTVTVKVRAESQAKAETLISDTIAFDMDHMDEVVEWST